MVNKKTHRTIKKNSRSSRTVKNSSPTFLGIESIVPTSALIPILALFLFGVSLFLLLFVVQRNSDDRTRAAEYFQRMDAAQLSTQLVGYWDMTVSSDSNEMIPAAFGAVGLQSSRPLQAVEVLSGEGVGVSTGTKLSTVGPIRLSSTGSTIATWFAMNSSRATLFELSSEEGVLLTASIVSGANGSIQITLPENEIVSIPVLPQDLEDRVFVAVSLLPSNTSKSGSQIKIMVNNTTTTKEIMTSLPSGAVNLMVGGTEKAGATGSIIVDEFGVWNRVFDEQSLDALYNNGQGVSYPFPEVEVSF